MIPAKLLGWQRYRARTGVAALLLMQFLVLACVSTPPPRAPATPAQIYGELFRDVQLGRVFPDSKTFVDTVAKRDPQQIVAAYQREKQQPGFDLRAFVEREFQVPVVAASEYKSVPGEDVRSHIDNLWTVLTRDPALEIEYSSRLPLPYRYVVPGGRFNEMYYWDSYFTMLGLQASGRHDLVRAMCDNFAVLIERYGHIPNGNRSYYVSRSQPPFFAAMVELLVAHEGDGARAHYRAALQSEYDFWMEGSERLTPASPAHRRAVRMQDGSILNRYWDDRATPREESYREDVEAARSSARPEEEMYRNLRAAAESGWDFSSRWFKDGSTLASIRTVDLVAVDLNSLLWQLEMTLARAYDDEADKAAHFRGRAESRRSAMHRYLWNEKAGAFTDYSWADRHSIEQVTAATATPLFFGIATADQAERVATAIRDTLLGAHGVLTTSQVTGQQWDAPNGWAPLQWMTIEGLRRYGHKALADDIAHRWVKQNLAVYRATGKLVEKYDVVAGTAAAGGGEYPLQDGFGWTNGVLRALLSRHPEWAQSPPHVPDD
ncbi:alpha,alpha-trehalase TreF [Povalibacter sp.]|uniref:alpha,alpha-trehalase TreF n=1 Tax=Povalibacter sp. TaxID=1962978 RepID=UPI002F3F2721